MDIWVHGTGTVWVKGLEVLHAEGRGRRWDLPGGGTVFAGWRGHLRLTGEDVVVKMWGGVFEFTARGTGWAFLKGRGHYRVHGQAGRWTPEGVWIEWPAGGTPD
jgi:hypothetical protein